MARIEDNQPSPESERLWQAIKAKHPSWTKEEIASELARFDALLANAIEQETPFPMIDSEGIVHHFVYFLGDKDFTEVNPKDHLPGKPSNN